MSKTILDLFPDIKKIDNIDELLKIAKMYDNKKFYFRGSSSPNHDLLPTLLREIEDCSCLPYEMEYDCNNELNAFLKDENDLISNLQIARHFGYKCRFLDITQSMWVALYFAFDDKKETYNEDKVLICIDIDKYTSDPLNKFYKSDKNNFKIYEMYEEYMNYGTIGVEEDDEDGITVKYDFKYPIFCKCQKYNRRIEKQKGAFLMYADLGKCDDEVQEFIAKHSVAYLLDKTIRGEVNKLCLENNCTSETLFKQTKVVDDIESFDDLEEFIKKINKKLNEGK